MQNALRVYPVDNVDSQLCVSKFGVSNAARLWTMWTMWAHFLSRAALDNNPTGIVCTHFAIVHTFSLIDQ